MDNHIFLSLAVYKVNQSPPLSMKAETKSDQQDKDQINNGFSEAPEKLQSEDTV